MSAILAYIRPARTVPAPPPAAPAPDDILTREEVAIWLRVKPRQVERLGVPCLNLGVKTKRYLRSDVAAWLAARRS